MAITSSTTVTSSVKQPDGYVAADLAEIANAEDTVFTTDIAVSNAHLSDPATGLNNILAAVKNYFDTDFAVNALKLDTTKAINANIYVIDIKRVNTAASIYLTGTEVFRCKVIVKYA